MYKIVIKSRIKNHHKKKLRIRNNHKLIFIGSQPKHFQIISLLVVRTLEFVLGQADEADHEVVDVSRVDLIISPSMVITSPPIAPFIPASLWRFSSTSELILECKVSKMKTFARNKGSKTKTTDANKTTCIMQMSSFYKYI